MSVHNPPQPYSCEAVRTLLGPLLDHECSAGEAERVRAHLASCARCAGEFEALATLQGQLRGVAREERASPELWSRVSERLRRVEAASPPPRFPQVSRSRRWALWTASAAALLVVAAGTRLAWRPPGIDPVIAEPVQDYITFRLSGRTEDFASDDAPALARWAERRITFAMPPIKRHIGEYHLAGARLCWLLDRRLAGLSYVRGDEKAVVYIMDGTGLSIPRPTEGGHAETDLHIHHYQGHGVAVWREHDLIHVLVARNETLQTILPELPTRVRNSGPSAPMRQAYRGGQGRPPPDSG